MRRWTKALLLLTLLPSMLLSACASDDPASPPQDLEAPPTSTQVVPTYTPSLPPPTNTPVTPTVTLSPTAMPAPVVRVSENTNCRSGPGVEYLFKGVLAVGEVTDVIARSADSDFLYIANPDIPGEHCWMWGEFAQVEGNLEAAPIITPAPSPTPLAGFDVYLKKIVECSYAKQIVFAVHNGGSQRIWSGYVEVQDLATRGALYSERERHPFADTVEPACPPGHGNELWPGETRFIHVPVSLNKSDIEGVAIITLCTEDHGGGTCMTEYSYFVLP